MKQLDRSDNIILTVDPENRLVAGDLERRWNERLAEVARLEEELRLVREKLPAALTETERADLSIGDRCCAFVEPPNGIAFYTKEDIENSS